MISICTNSLCTNHHLVQFLINCSTGLSETNGVGPLGLALRQLQHRTAACIVSSGRGCQLHCLSARLTACLSPATRHARSPLVALQIRGYPRTEGLTVCICGSHCVPQRKCLTVFLSLCATVQVSHCVPLTVCVYEQLQLTASWVESAGTSFSPTFL